MRKFVYMGIGGLLTLVLVFGAYVTLAQTDDDTNEDATEARQIDDMRLLDWERPNLRGLERGSLRGQAADERLAEALGISVEALQTAQEAAFVAGIEQAVDEGLITQEQADRLLSSEFVGRRGFWLPHGIPGSDIDPATLLAEALGISVEELQTAQAEVFAARLTELVEAEVITQEQADMLQAYKNVQDYVDYEALSETIQSFYEAAIEQALADEVITPAQADLLLERLSRLEARGFGLPGFNWPGGHDGPRGHGRTGLRGSLFFAPSLETAPETGGTEGI